MQNNVTQLFSGSKIGEKAKYEFLAVLCGKIKFKHFLPTISKKHNVKNTLSCTKYITKNK